jgi:hypothetical protein
LFKNFKSRDLGELKCILGIQIECRENTMIINQRNYIEKLINQFKNLKDSKSVDIPIQPNHKLTSDLTNETEELRQLVDPTTYRQAIGSLIYLMTATRPDISYAVSFLSRFMQEPKELPAVFKKITKIYKNHN